jgi:putative hydrolase of the HAD superfamily
MQEIALGSVDALLFDLGGVVIEIDFNRVVARWALHARRDPAPIKARFSFDCPYQRHERGEIDVSAYFASLRRSLDIDISDAQFMDGWNEVFVREVPGMAALLRRARARMPLYAFTNSNPAHRQAWLRQYAGIVGYFRTVFVSSDIGRRKPEPGAFHAVAAAIGVPAPRIAFFDDSLENVEGARASGMLAVHVRSIADVERSLEAILS